MPSRVDLRGFRKLVMVAIAIVAGAVLAMTLTVWGLHSDATEDATRDVGHIATILSEQTAQSIKAIDETLAGMQDYLDGLYEASPDDFQATLRSKELHLMQLFPRCGRKSCIKCSRNASHACGKSEFSPSSGPPDTRSPTPESGRRGTSTSPTAIISRFIATECMPDCMSVRW